MKGKMRQKNQLVMTQTGSSKNIGVKAIVLRLNVQHEDFSRKEYIQASQL